MELLLENLIFENDLPYKYDNAEIFVSCNKSQTIDLIDGGYVRTVETMLSGSSLRIYNSKEVSGLIYLMHGSLVPANFEQGVRNSIPYSELETIPVDSSELQNFRGICLKTEETEEEILYYINEKLKIRNLTLHNFNLIKNISGFWLANSYGVCGGGYKAYQCLNIAAYSKLHKELSFNYISSNLDTKQMLDDMLDETDLFMAYCGEVKDYDRSIEVVMLSEYAVGELMGVLFHVLNSQTLFMYEKTGQKNLIPDFNDLARIKLSSLLTVEENSRFNDINGGIVDGEGTYKKPTFLIENGVIKTPISSINYRNGTINTASAYRIDYSVLPQVKASKIYIYPGAKTKRTILNSYSVIGWVDSFQGIFESFNISTFDFDALLEVKIIEDGQFKGVKKKALHLNVWEVLKSIVEISSETKYVNDGSFKVPAFLCKMHMI